MCCQKMPLGISYFNVNPPAPASAAPASRFALQNGRGRGCFAKRRGCLSLCLDTFEDYADANRCIVKQFASFDSHNSSALYPRETAFSFGKGHCAREIQFDNVSGPQRRSCRNSHQHAAAAYVAASAVKKAVCLRQPDAYRPCNLCSCVFPLFMCAFSLTDIIAPVTTVAR